MKKVQLPKQYSRAKVDSSTFNEAENSIEVVFATETPVYRRGWDEVFNEVLVCNTANIRAGRLDNGAVPVLDNHSRWSVLDQMGTVESWFIKSGECRAKLKLSTQERWAGVVQDIKAGIIRSISVGYQVWKYVREKAGEGQTPTYRAVDWEPMEISFAPVPADFNSKVRTAEAGEAVHDVIIEGEIFNQRLNMENNETAVVEQTTGQTEQRSQSSAPATTVVNPAPVDEAAIRSAAIQAERTRATEIRNAVRKAGLTAEFGDDLVSRGISLDSAREQIINKLAENSETGIRGQQAPTVTGVDEADLTREAMADALEHRANPGSVNLQDKAHDFKHARLVDFAAACLRAKGDNPMKYSPQEMVHRAIATTDFPDLLTTVTNRTLRKSYESLPKQWQRLGTKTTNSDFRIKTGMKVDGSVTFEEIAEGGEYKEAKMLTNEKATTKLKTFGRKITIGRIAIINDDLSVFNRIPKMIAAGANNFQSAKVWGLILNNEKTPDGKAVFHVDHGNLASGAGNVGAPSIDLLSKARTAMWKHKNGAGDVMGVAPKILVVPIEHLTIAQQLMASINPEQSGSVNPFAGAYEIMTDPSITNANEWYLFADPSAVEGIVYTYLEGQEGLYTESQTDFNTDSVVTKARLDFDAAIWDYRGFYKNPGA